MTEIEKSYKVERLVAQHMEMSYCIFDDIHFDVIDTLADYIISVRVDKEFRELLRCSKV